MRFSVIQEGIQINHCLSHSCHRPVVTRKEPRIPNFPEMLFISMSWKTS